MQPTVGRIVHCQRDLSLEPLAAIVTRVREVPADAITPTEHHTFTVANVALAVHTGNAVIDLHDMYSGNPRHHHWNWPPRDPTPEPHTHGRLASPRLRLLNTPPVPSHI